MATLINYTGGYMEFAGLSTEDKPTDGVAMGSIFVEVNTGKVYFYNSQAESWVEQFSFQS